MAVTILKTLNSYIAFSFPHADGENKYAASTNWVIMASHANDFGVAIKISVGIAQWLYWSFYYPYHHYCCKAFLYTAQSFYLNYFC